jgi:1,4-dihydroxy-2-naphthoyl-CoA synthase
MAEVLAEIESGIAVITLNAPDRRNSFTVDMAEEFIGVVHAINGDPEIAVSILAELTAAKYGYVIPKPVALSAMGVEAGCAVE